MSKSKPSEGTVIFAHHQTGGRGQFGKSWESEPGMNLTFSIILYPVFLEARRAHSLNQVVCLGLKDFADSLPIGVRIKWPNDIYHHDKKLAGVLIENGVTGENLDYSIIGIGLNVNQTRFSSELSNPVSLKMIAGKEFDLDKVANELFPFVERRYAQLKEGRWAQIKEEYTNCLYNLGKTAFYRSSAQTFEGIIRGVDDNGQLLMETGEVQRVFNSNEVVYL